MCKLACLYCCTDKIRIMYCLSACLGVVNVSVSSAFCSEMHQNNIYIFYFLKFIFDISTSKQFKNTNKTLILSQKKLKFWANNILAAMPNTPYLFAWLLSCMASFHEVFFSVSYIKPWTNRGRFYNLALNWTCMNVHVFNECHYDTMEGILWIFALHDSNHLISHMYMILIWSVQHYKNTWKSGIWDLFIAFEIWLL